MFNNLFGKSDSEIQLEKDFLEFKEMHKNKIIELEGRLRGKEEFIRDISVEFNKQKIEIYNQSKQIDKLEREKEAVKEAYGNRILAKFCDVLNLFQMAKDSNAKTIEDLKQGVDLIVGNFHKTLGDFGIEKLDPVNEKFDPNLHEALFTETSDDVADGYVIRVLEAGYKKGEKIIKYAKVVVCSK